MPMKTSNDTIGNRTRGLLACSIVRQPTVPSRESQADIIIIIIIIIITYLLTTWKIVFLEKLTGLQLVKKYPIFYGTKMFITAFTSALHLSVS